MREPYDVMFVNLPMSRDLMEKTGKPELVAENLGLAYLTACLRQSGFRVKILDAIAAGWTTEEILAQVIASKPRLVGLPIFQSTRQVVLAFARKLKEKLPGTTVILGGQLARQAARDLLKYEGVDLLCTGEGEHLITAVLSGLDHQDYRQLPGLAWKEGEEIQVNPSAPFLTDLGALPRPARDTLTAVMNRG
jgi:anaerobic magnesium-protoporphyrin IX monomethyl ester cyclase